MVINRKRFKKINQVCRHTRWEWQKESIKGRNYIRKWKKCKDTTCGHTWGHKRVYRGQDG